MKIKPDCRLWNVVNDFYSLVYSRVKIKIKSKIFGTYFNYDQKKICICDFFYTLKIENQFSKLKKKFRKNKFPSLRLWNKNI